MKNLFLALILITPLAHSEPYVEYKNVYTTKVQVHNLRAGYSWAFNDKFKAYVETGPVWLDENERDIAWEAGYKLKLNKWLIKGKTEGIDRYKVETEVRFTF